MRAASISAAETNVSFVSICFVKCFNYIITTNGWFEKGQRRKKFSLAWQLHRTGSKKASAWSWRRPPGNIQLVDEEEVAGFGDDTSMAVGIAAGFGLDFADGFV